MGEFQKILATEEPQDRQGRTFNAKYSFNDGEREIVSSGLMLNEDLGKYRLTLWSDAKFFIRRKLQVHKFSRNLQHCLKKVPASQF